MGIGAYKGRLAKGRLESGLLVGCGPVYVAFIVQNRTRRDCTGTDFTVSRTCNVIWACSSRAGIAIWIGDTHSGGIGINNSAFFDGHFGDFIGFGCARGQRQGSSRSDGRKTSD